LKAYVHAGCAVEHHFIRIRSSQKKFHACVKKALGAAQQEHADLVGALARVQVAEGIEDEPVTGFVPAVAPVGLNDFKDQLFFTSSGSLEMSSSFFVFSRNFFISSPEYPSRFFRIFRVTVFFNMDICSRELQFMPLLQVPHI
jgi:hypothetical protein